MEDKFLNGWSTRNLIERLTTDERCPSGIQRELRQELPAFNVLRRSQTGRLGPAELFPMSGFVMRVEGLLMAGVREPERLKPMIRNIAQASALPLSTEDLSSLVDAFLNPKDK